jgi:hypothetical protein
MFLAIAKLFPHAVGFGVLSSSILSNLRLCSCHKDHLSLPIGSYKLDTLLLAYMRHARITKDLVSSAYTMRFARTLHSE